MWFNIPPYLFIVHTLPWETLSPETHKLSSKAAFFESKQSDLYFICPQLLLVTRTHNKCSKCVHLQACTHALSCFFRSSTAASITFCWDVQTSTMRSFSSSTLFIRHSYYGC